MVKKNTLILLIFVAVIIVTGCFLFIKETSNEKEIYLKDLPKVTEDVLNAQGSLFYIDEPFVYNTETEMAFFNVQILSAESFGQETNFYFIGDAQSLQSFFNEIRMVDSRPGYVKQIIAGMEDEVKSMFSGTWETLCHPIKAGTEMTKFSGKMMQYCANTPMPQIISDLSDLWNAYYVDKTCEMADSLSVNYFELRTDAGKSIVEAETKSRIGGQAFLVFASTVIPATKIKYASTPTKIADNLSDATLFSKVGQDFTKFARFSRLFPNTEKKMTVALNRSEKVNKTNRDAPHKDKLDRNSRKIKGCGPEDQLFDKNKNVDLIKRGEKVYDEASFQKGLSEIPGRKPTPDGMSVDYAKNIKTYIEDKRPSECQNNSWRSTYKGDPIAKERVSVIRDLKNRKITKAEADARIVIAEHDDHYAKRGSRWTDPAGVPSKGFKDKLAIRIPDSSPLKRIDERVDAIVKHLKDTGRNPEVGRENGIVSIRYDVKK